MAPKKAKATTIVEVQNEENRQPVETEQISPKKATTKKTTRGRKKSEAEKLQEEASGFIERVNKKSEVGDDSTDDEIEEEQISKKKTNKTTTTGTTRVGKRQVTKNMPTHDELNEDEEQQQSETSVPIKTSMKTKNDDEEIENDGDSPSKKPKAKVGRKQVQKSKTNLPDGEIENEQIDEIDTKKKTSTGKGKGKAPGSTKKQAAIVEKFENEETPANDELKLSEDEETVVAAVTTGKKGATKRSAPVSNKKTGPTSAKKKGQIDEPLDDRTNDDAENTPEDEPTTAKQPKKGRPAADKASVSTNKSNKTATTKKTK